MPATAAALANVDLLVRIGDKSVNRHDFGQILSRNHQPMSLTGGAANAAIVTQCIGVDNGMIVKVFDCSAQDRVLGGRFTLGQCQAMVLTLRVTEHAISESLEIKHINLGSFV